MIRRAVYDTMVFFQWAALPEDRQHGTIKALYEGAVQLCVSQALLDEVRDVLSRPAIQAKSPNLTEDRVRRILDLTLGLADWYADVPLLFTWPQHPDDDHIFNLAIASKADFLVTWENRLHKFFSSSTPDAQRLKKLAPQLQIVTPSQLLERLRNG